MLLYNINIMMLLILAFIIKPNKGIRNSNVFLIVSFIQMICIYTIRSYNVGWDAYNYSNFFISSNNILWSDVFNQWMEFGYVILNKTVRCFTDNYNVFWFVLGMIIFIPIFKTISRYSDNIMFSIYIYITLGFYYNSMNVIRQAIAISICLYAFKKIIDKKYWSAIFITLIASCFHSSAVVFIVFIITAVKVKDMNWKNFCKILISTIIVLILFNYLIVFISKFIYISYLEEPHLAYQVKGGELNMFIVFFAISLFGMIYRNDYISKYYSKKRTYDMCLMAVVFGAGLQLISIKLSLIARFTYYFTIYSAILIPNVFSCMKDKKKKILIGYVVVVSLCAYSYIYLCIAENGVGKDRVIPYQFFWQA